MATKIRNTDGFIYSRDVITDIEELRARIEELTEDKPVSEYDQVELSQAYIDLQSLEALAGQASRYSEDGEDAVVLIRDDYFTEYAREFADDIGDASETTRWPFRHIDWKAAADDLKQDYTAVDFDGVTYWLAR